MGGEKVGRYVRKNEPLRRLALPRIRSQGSKNLNTDIHILAFATDQMPIRMCWQTTCLH